MTRRHWKNDFLASTDMKLHNQLRPRGGGNEKCIQKFDQGSQLEYTT
jgi:hypothetical protein